MLSWKALEALHDHFANAAIRLCNSGEAVAPQLFVVEPNAAGEPVKMGVLPAELMQTFMSGPAGGDMLMTFVRDALTQGHPLRQQFIDTLQLKPTVLVHISEAWALSPLTLADGEDYTSGRKRVSQNPARMEVLLVTLHFAEGSVPTFHVIEEVPHRHCIKGRFPSRTELGSIGGRLTLQEAFIPEEPEGA